MRSAAKISDGMAEHPLSAGKENEAESNPGPQAIAPPAPPPYPLHPLATAGGTTVYANFSDRVQSWKTRRRVVTKIEWHSGRSQCDGYFR